MDRYMGKTTLNRKNGLETSLAHKKGRFSPQSVKSKCLSNGTYASLSRVGGEGWEKRGQVAETMTWVIATVAVIVLTILFIYFTSTLAGTKKLKNLGESRESLSSPLGSQEMLFALLTYKSATGERVRVLIEQGKYDELRLMVERVLGEYEREGVKCGFILKREGERGVLMELAKEGAGQSTGKVVLGGKEAIIRC